MPKQKSRPKPPPRTPYKHLLPPLSREEFDALRASIQANGVLHPAIFDEHGNVLDGHNRLSIDPDAPRRVIRGLSESEKRAFVFASNMARRNLSPAQKKAALDAMKAVARALREEDPKTNTQKRIAELLGVSRVCVTRWFLPARADMRNVTHNITHNESAFLADARFTIPRRIRPAIIRRCRSGESQATIAADFKVAQSTISRIYRRHLADQQAAAQAKRDAARAAPLGDQNIIIGDYRTSGNVLASNSVDLIFTDPPFDKRHIRQYADLGQFAARVLKPGGSLITYLGDYALPEILSHVLQSRELRFWWPLAVLHAGQTRVLDKFGVAVRHKTLLWFVKGGQRARKHQVDTLVLSQRDKRHHRWQQGLTEAAYYIARLTPPGGLVVDPYAGSGTTCLAALRTGRRYLAFERNSPTARRARARLAAATSAGLEQEAMKGRTTP